MDKIIETGFGPIHTHVKRSGPAILLAHGYHPENSCRVWEHNVEALAELGCTVYALDPLGYGESGFEALDYTGQAEALLELMDAEGLQRATIGWVSWGGHHPMRFKPAEFNRVATSFLTE